MILRHPSTLETPLFMRCRSRRPRNGTGIPRSGLVRKSPKTAPTAIRNSLCQRQLRRRTTLMALYSGLRGVGRTGCKMDCITPARTPPASKPTHIGPRRPGSVGDPAWCFCGWTQAATRVSLQLLMACVPTRVSLLTAVGFFVSPARFHLLQHLKSMSQDEMCLGCRSISITTTCK